MFARSAVVPLVVAATSLVAPALLAAQPELTDTVGTLEVSRELDARGNLGGVTIDRLGFVYVANFRDALWKISPEGEVELVTRGLYGSSGNAVGPSGELYQANFFGDTISRISRTGEVARFADEGLEGPVGIAVAGDGMLYVCNCRGNFLAAVSPSGAVSRLVEGDFFACPNGIVFGPDEKLYVTNFNNHDILRVSTDGEAEVFATVPGGAGNAHIAFAKDFFFVTKIIAHQIVRVSLDGEVFPLAGTGRPGHDDGPAPEATLTNPNGIAVSPRGDVLYVNTVNGTYSGNQPSRVTVRTIDLLTLSDVLDAAQETGGVEAMETAYDRYREDPVRGRENTVAEMVAYGYRHMSGGKVPVGLEIFRLNAEGNPDDPTAQYHQGEAFRYTGQTEAAIAQYERTLELDPDHRLAKSRLAQLSGE